MRSIVACTKCNRQYDAAGSAVGRRFRCRCGTVLTVEQPRGHDADVVCCASCGAPRQQGSLRCDHCDADFTLHERDLHTVCPKCLARVSDRARFCHFCAARINPEMAAGEKSELLCPVCGEGRTLRSRAWDSVSILECDRCAGIWLGSDSFRELAESAAKASVAIELEMTPQRARPAQAEGPLPEGGRYYRPCVVCQKLMVRQNYGGSSGVVVDWCRLHGMWFDADELSRILDWIRRGGLVESNAQIAARRQEQEETTRRENALGPAKDFIPTLSPLREGDDIEPIFDRFIRMLFRV